MIAHEPSPTGVAITLRQIRPFLVGADAHIGPKDSIFNSFGTIEMAHNWLFPLYEALTSAGDGPMWASAPTVESLI